MFSPADAISTPFFKTVVIALFVANHVVGWEQAKNCIGVGVQQDECRQADCRRRVASHRLSQNLTLVQSRKLAHDLTL